MIRLALVALAVAAVAAPLAACGRQGELARPAPLFGGGNLPPQTATGPAAASDPDGDPVEGTQADQPGSTGRGTGTRNPASSLDPNRARDPASVTPVEGVSDPIGNRPSTSPR